LILDTNHIFKNIIDKLNMNMLQLKCDDYFFFVYYEAEGGVLKLLETGAPYAPHVKAKIT